MANAERENGSGAPQASTKPEGNNVVPIFDIDEMRRRYGVAPRPINAATDRT